MAELQEIFLTAIHMVIIAAVPALTAVVIAFIRKKAAHITSQMSNETARHSIAELENAITAAVAKTSQTYVDELKKTNAFSSAAQSSALKQAKDTALASLSPTTRKYLQDAHDLQCLIEAMIEAEVRSQK